MVAIGAPLVERGALLGRYRLRELLGSGGMAEVWLADVEGPGGFTRPVVLKRVLPHLVARGSHFIDMFLQEARLSARLDHPNIVKVFELGQVGTEYFLTMEYVRGADLGHLVRRGFVAPIPMSVAIVQAICRALDHAHTLRDENDVPLRIVHRDVTPSNIMLGRDGTVKLFDFGIAKALALPATQRTLTGTLKGKRGYMAPEQIRGELLDHRIDIFAAGVVLHELLTGKRLFKGETDWQVSRQVLEDPIPAPSSIHAEVPPALDAIVLRALQRDPAQRYATAEQMADALGAHAVAWDASRMQRTLSPLFADTALEKQRLAIPATETVPPEDNAATQLDHVAPFSTTARGRSLVSWAIGTALVVFGGWAIHRAVERKHVTPPSPLEPQPPKSPIPTDVDSKLSSTSPMASPQPPPMLTSESPTSPTPKSAAAAHSAGGERKAPVKKRTAKLRSDAARGVPASSVAPDPDGLLPDDARPAHR